MANSFTDEFPSRPADLKLDAISGEVDLSELEGHSCLYRLGFQSMIVFQLPDITPSTLLERFHVGEVEILQTTGPVRTQRTTLVQRPGLELEWYKHMESRVPVGHGLPLSVLQVRGTFSDRPLADLTEWREKALNAAGIATCVFDERLFKEKVFEDAIVFDRHHQVVGTLDESQGVRHFMPRFILDENSTDFEAMRSLDLQESKPAAMAAKWYLRAAQGSPSSDSVVALWVALEALLAQARGSSMVQKVEAALILGGYPLPEKPTVKRMYRVRGAIVHDGDESPKYLSETHYQLETIVRTLLRARLGLEGAWHPSVGLNVFDEPLRSAIDAAWKNPKTIMT